MIHIVTAPITSLWSIWLQQLSRLSDLPCYSNYHVFMTYMVTATITSIWSILLQQLSRPSDLICHSNYVFMINLVTVYYVLMITIPGERPPCTHSRDWRTPARCAIPGAARRTPRQTSKTMPFVLSYCFFSVLPFVLFDICRTEDHKPRGRASNVSTISTCVSLYVQWFTAHSPTQSLWERAGGITVVYLCGF